MKTQILMIECRMEGRHWVPYKYLNDNRTRLTALDKLRRTLGYKYFRLASYRRIGTVKERE